MSPLGTYTKSAAIAPSAGKTALEVNSLSGTALVDGDGVVLGPVVAAELRQKEVRIGKWVMQAGVRKLMPKHRTAVCLRAVLPPERRGVLGVEVWQSAKHKTAHYGNLMTCGNVWTCPVCGPKIAARRAREVEQAIRAWQGSGGAVAFLTMTVPHYAHDYLRSLLPDFTGALSSFWSNRGVKEAAQLAGVVGSIRALEVTHGANGWHPHTHYLVFLAPGADIPALHRAWFEVWGRTVRRRLGRDINGHGLDLVQVGGGADQGGTDEDAEQLARYVVKSLDDDLWGPAQELTFGHLKQARFSGRSPFALLHDYTFSGDDQAGELFAEFAGIFHGKRQLFWSRGLRAQLLGAEEEISDEEIAEQLEEEASLLGTLTLEQWRRVLAAPGRDTRGVLLEVAEDGGWPAVERFLESLPVLSTA